jgi:hypothetical protein
MINPLELKESVFHTAAGIRLVKETFTGDDFYPSVTHRNVPANVTIIPDQEFGERPMPGDAVRLVGHYTALAQGSIAVIQGTVGTPQESYSIVFSAQAFRGPGNSSHRAGAPIEVSCSGGPVILRVPAAELIYTGERRTAYFWHWRKTIEADGGQHYAMEVPLWDWAGLPD